MQLSRGDPSGHDARTGPADLTAGLFAFLASMDNYPVSIFLTDARTKTLPIKMLQYIEESRIPTIAALSTSSSSPPWRCS